ncbi:MAG: DUF3501 family protein [Myxococcota bacterium]
MRRLEAGEILDLTAYEKVRDAFRSRIIALKNDRRVAVGDRLSFLFENRDTVSLQVHEMIRTERLVDPEAIAQELEIYNELIPKDGELSATLMIEIPDAGDIRTQLDRLIGIDEHVHLDIGAESVQATFDPKQFEEDRISAVQYVRFPLGPRLARDFVDPRIEIRLRVAHPAYVASTTLGEATRRALARDLLPEG